MTFILARHVLESTVFAIALGFAMLFFRVRGAGARHALWFGIGLAVLASAVFAFFVNPLALVLSLVGLLGYVFIYTLWLKRSTPSNIVIGGAAGAIPPLVGWAAVTGEIGSLTAWYLFAIIFFWTKVDRFSR